MRVCIALVVAACVACKKSDSPPKQGSAGSGSETVAATGDAAPAVALADAAASGDAAVAAVADAGAPLAKFCIDRDADEDRMLREIASDDASVTFCLALEEKPAKCAKLDLAAGTFAAVAEQPERPAKVAQLQVDTATLDLPKGEHEWAAAQSPDGKTIAATTDIEGQLFIVDAVTKKVRKIVKWEADGGCMEPPHFIGDNIYVQYNVCAGPGATGWIVSVDGKKLGGPKHVNPTGNFFPLGGSLYAFEDFNGTGIEVVDGKTGKSIKHVDMASSVDCDDCASFRTGGLGTVQTGSKLVVLSHAIFVIDPKALKIEKTIKWPLCGKAVQK